MTRRQARPPAAATEPVAPPIALVVIDDNRLVREGLAAVIHSQPDLTVLAAAADAAEALEKVREAQPDVVLLDLGLADGDSLAMTARVHGEVPTAKVIVMGLLPAHEDVTTYVQAGASGFIMKDASLEDFFATIRAVASGVEVLPQALTHSLFTQVAREAALGPKDRAIDAVRLTPRERQVIALIGEGRTNDGIATQLRIAVHTVKSEVNSVMEKLALHNHLDVVGFPDAGPAGAAATT